MMPYVFLVVLAGQTCVPTTKENLLSDVLDVCSLIQFTSVKCLDPSTGRVYISRDVVFDESVFSFASLNPNAGRRLQKDILLFPTHTSSTSGDAHIDDYMSLPVIPNVTNVNASDISHTAIQVDAHQNTEHDDTEPSSGSETDASGATSGEDPADDD
jgi:hypothetical protein